LDRTSVKCFAKINLLLRVLGKRADGYHEISTLLQAIDLHDEIALTKKARGITIRCSRETVPLGAENLAYRAAKLLERECGHPLGVEIEIEKRIPVAAGLGGGSSDAAGALLGLNELYGLGVKKERLQRIGSELGSDVPFFLSRGQALATGRGEKIEEIRLPLDYFLVLLKPPFGISSSWAYKKTKKDLTREVQVSDIVRWDVADQISGIIPFFENDLEIGVISEFEEIGRLKGVLNQEGALFSQMSGSGPTVYGIFDREERAKQVASALSGEAREVFLSRPVLLH
jgi:4-diphosphocytidyl-2-C-methyl-D-erythritol kinase